MTRYDSFPSPARQSAGGPRHISSIWWLASGPLLLFLVAPLVVLVLRTSPAAMLATLNSEAARAAIRLSLVTSTVTMGAAVLFGTPLAYLLAHGHFRGRRLVETLVELPIVLPPAVAGVALLLAFGRRGPAGSVLDDWGVTLAFTTTAVIMAQLFVSAPLFVRSAALGFATLPADLAEAAALDGAGDVQLFRHVGLPLAHRALLAGATLTWARALGEFGATLIFAGNFPGRTQTMPLAIYLGFEFDLELAVTLSVILLGLSFLVIGLVRLVFERGDRD